MSLSTKDAIVAKIQNFVSCSDFLRLQKSKPLIAQQIKNIKSTDLVFGETMEATFFRGYFEGNVRSEGFQRNDDITTTRTLNFNFTTGTIGFVDDDNTADEDALYAATELLDMHMYNLGAGKYSNFDQLGSEIYRQTDSTFAIIRNLVPLCRFEHEKLNYILRPDSIKILQAEFTREESAKIPICRVYANFTDKKGRPVKTFLGYYAKFNKDKNTEGKLIINSSYILGKTKKKNYVKQEGNGKVGKIIKWFFIALIPISIIIPILTNLANA